MAIFNINKKKKDFDSLYAFKGKRHGLNKLA